MNYQLIDRDTGQVIHVSQFLNYIKDFELKYKSMGIRTLVSPIKNKPINLNKGAQS